MNLIRANELYNVKITDFEGPLDLLLHLIREEKLDIKTVKLADVTAQYLKFLAQLDKLDLDLASEFIEVGAILVEIKGRNILPGETEEEEDPEDLESRLRIQLEEYKLLKEQSEKLKSMEVVGRFYKNPEQLKTEIKYSLDGLNMDALISAFTRVMHKIEQNAAPISQKQIRLDRFTVADKIKQVHALLGEAESIAFFDLFESDFSRSEIINTFLAVLELLKHQQIRAAQPSPFADILIIRGECFGQRETGESEFTTAAAVAD